jgi:DNA repair exonuclease SbcCD nuclease subunit
MLTRNEFVVGDIHLNASWDGQDRTEDAFDVLYQIKKHIEDTIDENPSNTYHSVFWLGDIFDSPNVPHSHIARFIEYLASFKSDHMVHRIIKGNHDGDRDSKRGSPLLEIEAAGVADVYWEPKLEFNTCYIPYCSQEVLDKFVATLDPSAHIKYMFTHTDLMGITPGTEKMINRGLPCVLPQKLIDWPSKPLIFAGHIHEPYQKNNLVVLGSIIKTSISEITPKRIFCSPYENETGYFWSPQSRDVKSFKINYSTEEGKLLYQKLLKNENQMLLSSDIVSVDIVCPHNIAHELDQIKFKDIVSKYCHYLRLTFNVLKEKQFRMKEVDALSDVEIVKAVVAKQGISDADVVVKDVVSLMEA